MIANITNEDIELCKTRTKYTYIKLLLLDSNLNPIDELQGECISGSINIDVTSDNRRTCNLELYHKDSSYDVAEYNKIWLNRRVKVQMGFLNIKTNKIVWYDMGIFVFNSCTYSFSGDSKTISIDCSDLVSMINGTHGGIQDGEQFKILQGEDLRKVIQDLLKYEANIDNYYVEPIGEYGCLRNKSVDWKENRIDSGTSREVADLQEKDGVDYLDDSPYLDEYEIIEFNGTEICADSSEENIVSGVEVENYIDMGSWHRVPYDLEFDAGTSLYEMIAEVRDLYEGYESYFDKDGMFIVDLIPTCENDQVLLENNDLAPLVISESIDTDFTTIKNATRIYGKSIEADRFSDEKTTFLSYDSSLNAYVITITLDKYILTDGTKIGFIMPVLPDMSDDQKKLPLYIKVNSYVSSVSATGEITSTTTPKTIPCKTRTTVVQESANAEETKDRYLDKVIGDFVADESYCFKYVSNQDCYQYLGMYQVEAYIEDHLESSPFSVDKIGLRLQVLTGDDYDNITDTELCQQRAEYENWLAGRFNDTLTLQTIVIPFLEGNQKISYRSKMNGELNSYIVKSISFNLVNDGTSQITMSRYYDLYPDIIAP